MHNPPRQCSPLRSRFLLVINTILLSNDKSLITLSTNQGYKIYSNKTHKCLHSNNQVGSLLYANTYYQSNILFFIPVQTNRNFSSNCFYIWNAESNVQLGSIELTTSLTSAYVSRDIIYIFTTDSNILLFALSTLAYIKTLRNAYASDVTASNKIAFAVDKGFIQLNCYALYGDNKYNESICKFDSTFDYVQVMKFCGKEQKKLVITNYLGNKLHVYHVEQHDATFVYCVYLGSNNEEILNVCVDEKDKFIMITRDDKVVDLYKMREIGNTRCVCGKYDDRRAIERKGMKEEKSIFSSWFEDIRERLFNNEKVLPYEEFSVNEGKIIFSDYAIDKKNKINVILDNSVIKEFYFNRKKGKTNIQGGG